MQEIPLNSSPDKEFLEELKKSECAPHWKKIGLYPHHGFILMLSSIHSEKSTGIGEFLDLIPLIKWASEIGLDFIQLMPLTDSGRDNSPYNPLSTLALNPVYISLHDLPHFKKDEELQTLYKRLKAKTNTKHVHYQKIRWIKLEFFREYYRLYYHAFENLKAFKDFKKSNPWVYHYALFMKFMLKADTQTWKSWPKHQQKLSPEKRLELCKKDPEEINFHILLQFIAYEQMRQVKKQADQSKVFLFGDLPFLVSQDSVDAWCHPELFSSTEVVGSPPDRLTPEGQNWQFPAYNWEEHKKDKYAWWKLRLKNAENYFHIYRLDHIIGFYRTWNIPVGKEGKDGYYSPRDPSTWLDHGRSFLRTLIQSSNMLPIGEDLVIPQSIIDSMRALGISGTRILTWQRTGAGGLDFVPAELYTVASITSLATHDTPTIAQWWRMYPKTAKEFALWRGWKYTPSLGKEKRFELLHLSHHTTSLFHANLLTEYLGLFPELVHKSMNRERINYPGTPSKKNWRYRYVPQVEEIVKHRKLAHAIKKIIA